jgi:hypothetical protein
MSGHASQREWDAGKRAGYPEFRLVLGSLKQYVAQMSTVDEIAAAIKELSGKDRAELIARLPEILPGMDGDAKWERIIRDSRRRPALEKLLDEVEAAYQKSPEGFRETSDEEFERNS